MDSFNSGPPLTDFQRRMLAAGRCIWCGTPRNSRQRRECNDCRRSVSQGPRAARMVTRLRDLK